MRKDQKLYIFEGPDGVGKSSLALGLYNYLTSIDDNCDYFTFPGKETGTLGLHVYEIHHSPEHFGINSITPEALQTLHIAAHVDSLRNRILPSLERGRTVILDRFWWSTVAYGQVYGVAAPFLEKLIQLELIEWKNIQPSLVFLILRKAPLLTNYDTEQWKKLNTRYKALARRERRNYDVKVIHNESSLTEIVHKIATAVNANLPSDSRKYANPIEPKSSELMGRNRFQLRLWDEPRTHRLRTDRITVFSKLSPAKPTEVYDTYWKFAVERQEIFYRKVFRVPPPWTRDPILSKFKFTNAYRASDRVSQYLIRNVIYSGDQAPEEVFFRIMVFKLFNRIETWERLAKDLKGITYLDYSFEIYDAILSKAQRRGEKIYSAAYIMPSGQTSFGFPKKHQNNLKLIELMMEDEVPHRIGQFKSMRELFDLLRSYPTLGDFLAYQFAIDINYSELTNFSEMEFVMPGPGARDGIRKCFKDLGGLNESEIIRIVADRQTEEFARLGLTFKSLWGRPLQLIDCQNLFCEVDKYARIAHPNVKGITGRLRIKQTYSPEPSLIEFWYPPKWEINQLILESRVTK